MVGLLSHFGQVQIETILIYIFYGSFLGLTKKHCCIAKNVRISYWICLVTSWLKHLLIWFWFWSIYNFLLSVQTTDIVDLCYQKRFVYELQQTKTKQKQKILFKNFNKQKQKQNENKNKTICLWTSNNNEIVFRSVEVKVSILLTISHKLYYECCN